MIYCRCKLEKKERGVLFARNNGRKASIGDYDPMFQNVLERGQNLRPGLFTIGVSIVDLSLRQSPRRGATTEEGNNNVDTVNIELINMWSKREAEKGAEAGLLMRQVYAQVSRVIVAAMCFSQIH